MGKEVKVMEEGRETVCRREREKETKTKVVKSKTMRISEFHTMHTI